VVQQAEAMMEQGDRVDSGALVDTAPFQNREDALRGLFDRSVRVVERYAAARLPRDDVAEVTAEVFSTLWRRLPVVPTDPDAQRLWIYGSAKRVVANHRRGAVRRARLLLKLRHSSSVGVDASASSSSAGVLQEAIAKLSLRDRELLTLRYWDDLDLQSIAHLYGVSVDAVRVRLHRARGRLAERLCLTGERSDSELK